MNILTFDIEEWFHILDNPSTKTVKEWNGFESRIHANTDRILQILKERNQKATFFCLGWVAKKYPEVIRKIDQEGFEIACHSSKHQLVYEQTPDEFKFDLVESLDILEAAIGKKVVTYRAPGFSITQKCKWAFELMAETGIENDSSVFPAERIHGGFPDFPANKPSLIRINGLTIREFPVNIKSIAGRKIVFSGGGYFRLFPYKLIKRWTARSSYVMSYLHPRDFDYKQPFIKELSLGRKFRSYVGLKGAEKKLGKWLHDFDFIDLRTAIERINWDEVETIRL